MELKAGYKQTTGGVIPDGWEISTVGDVAIKVGSGITPTGGRRVYRLEGRPFLRSQNVGWGCLLLDDIAFIDEETHGSFSATEIKLNDVLLNITGASIGRSAVADERLLGGNVNQHVCIIRVDANRLSSHFLNLFLLSKSGQEQIDNFQAGGNRQGLNFGQIRSFQIPLPPLPEQQAIAATLSDVDALISALDKLIAKKCDIKQAAMQQLLTGKKRLPGFSGEWEVKKLGEMGGCIRGVSYKGESDLHPYDTDHTVRLLRANNVQDATIVSNDLQFVNSRRVTDEQILLQDDIVICMSSGSKELVGKTAFFNLEDAFPYTFGAFMGCFRLNRNLADSSFVSFWLQTQEYRDFISILLSGSSINNLKPGDIESIRVLLPPLPEQQAIATILSDMDAEIAALEQKRDKTRALKQGMMQELLTGKTRLL